MIKNQKGFSFIHGLMLLTLLGLIAIVGWRVWLVGTTNNKSEPPTTSERKTKIPDCAHEQELSATCAEKINGAIIITESGSTNSVGWKLTINADGSGYRAYEPIPERLKANYRNFDTSIKYYPKGQFEAQKLTALLDKYGDVSDLKTTDCIKSDSAGSSSYITYKGMTSQDVACPGKGQKGEAIATEVLKITQDVVESNFLNKT